MTTVYFKTQYEELAEAVNCGMPMREALKILEQQRKFTGKGEQYFWLKYKQ